MTAAALLLSGCGKGSEPQAVAVAGGDGQVNDSEAVSSEPSEPSEPSESSVLSKEPGEIDPGNYRTTPLAPFGPVATPFMGGLVEGQRMAEFVILPSEVDPTLTKGAGGTIYVIKGGKGLQPLIGLPVADAAEANGAIGGFSTGRSTEESSDSRSLIHAVVRFPTAAAATKAADDMHHALIAVPNEWGSELETPTAIDILPDTRVSTDGSGGGDWTINSFTPHNEYVIYTYAKASEAQKDWTAQITAKALEAQIVLIDKFTPTPVDKLGELPIDIDGVLRLAVPKDSSEVGYTGDQAVYGQRGAAHNATDPAGALKYFEETGMTNKAKDETNVYMTRDEAGAKQLATAFAKEAELLDGLKKIAGPPGVPDAGCWQTQSTRDKPITWCLVQVDKYVGEIQSKDQTAAYQLASAQHLILKAPK